MRRAMSSSAASMVRIAFLATASAILRLMGLTIVAPSQQRGEALIARYGLINSLTRIRKFTLIIPMLALAAITTAATRTAMYPAALEHLPICLACHMLPLESCALAADLAPVRVQIAPWCHTTSEEPIWDYCDVPPPSSRPCNHTLPLPPTPNVTRLVLNTFVSSHAAENSYVFFDVDLAPSQYYIKVVVVPHVGDPDLFVSFDTRFPTGANYTFMQEEVGVHVFEMGRYSGLFCGAAGPTAPCSLHLGILGFEAAQFSVAVLAVDEDTFRSPGADSALLCKHGCEWRSLGDGVCNPQCDNLACFNDRQDCATSATGCKVPTGRCLAMPQLYRLTSLIGCVSSACATPVLPRRRIATRPGLATVTATRRASTLHATGIGATA